MDSVRTRAAAHAPSRPPRRSAVRPAALVCSGAAALTLALAGPAQALPVASFTVSTLVPKVGQPVTFNGAASTCTVAPCSYSWRWYRPTTATDYDRLGTSMGYGVKITYAFARTGPKRVVLTVTAGNSTHGSGSLSRTVWVKPPA